MYFIGGGLGGRGALPADNTPAQRKTPLSPPQNPPFLNLALVGVFKQDIRFPRTPPHPERDATIAEQGKALVHSYLREGWQTFFFDGSIKHYDNCGYVGEYGWCFPGPWEFVAPLDEDERQTNNMAELEAAIAAVMKVTWRTVVFGDSKYVLDGVKGEAYKWRRNGWCGPKGPVPNSML